MSIPWYLAALLLLHLLGSVGAHLAGDGDAVLAGHLPGDVFALDGLHLAGHLTARHLLHLTGNLDMGQVRTRASLSEYLNHRHNGQGD